MSHLRNKKVYMSMHELNSEKQIAFRVIDSLKKLSKICA